MSSDDERSQSEDSFLLMKEERRLLELGLGIALTLILMILVAGAVVVQLSPQLPEAIRGIKKLGEVGDFVGGVLNPVIALLALTALFRSIQIQRRELRETKEALQEQTRTHNKQRLEDTFFQLMSLRASAVSSIEWSDPSGTTRQGRSALKLILEDVQNIAQGHTPADVEEDLQHWQVPPNAPDVAKPYIAAFAFRYSGEAHSPALQEHLGYYGALPNYEPELGHVFRATYQILKFIRRHDEFSAAEKEDMANYLRAQMSEDDFLFFGLTAVTKIGIKSRAAAISLDFYQKRLQSIPWARDMLDLFDSSNPENAAFAASMGFPVLR